MKNRPDILFWNKNSEWCRREACFIKSSKSNKPQVFIVISNINRKPFNFCTGLLLSHMLINVKLPRTIFAYKISFPLCWLHIHVHVCIDLLTNSNICSLNTCLVLKEGQCISRELLWFTVDIIKETTCALNS